MHIEKHKIFEKNIVLIKQKILFNFKNIDNYVYGNNNKNTVLLIEPRFIENLIYILANTYNKLGNNWNYVFYCGKSFKDIWSKKLPNFIEIRPLDVDNFDNSKLYSDFCKKKELWKSLYGNYILTIQLDSWIMNIEPFNINFFLNLEKSFIGGNMKYEWVYFNNINIKHKIRNFNGGLSLRKKNDMIKVIETFPPLKTLDDNKCFLTEHEDVYFVCGCICLSLSVGDDIKSSFFSLHTIFNDKYFGIHNPFNDDLKYNLNKTIPYLKFINNYLNL